MSHTPECQWQIGARKEGKCRRLADTRVEATHIDLTPYQRPLCHWHAEEIKIIRGKKATNSHT